MMRKFLPLFITLSFLFLCGFANGQDTANLSKAQNVLEQIQKYLKVGGWFDAQYAYEYYDAENQSSVFQIRRARLDIKGSPSKWVDYRLQADFAPNPRLIDAFVKVNFCKQVQLQIGQFKIPFSLENKLSPLDLELMENAQVVSALSGYKDVTGISSYSNGREIGAMLTGTLASAEVCGERIPILQYGVGIFGGNGINVKTDNLAKDVSARVEFSPFVKGLTLSASGYWGKYDMLHDGVTTHTDGARTRYAGGLQYTDRQWVLRGEYLWGKTDFAAVDPLTDDYVPIPTRTQGFYVTAGYWFRFGWGDNSKIEQKLRPLLRFDYYEKDKTANTNSIYYSTGVEWWPEKHLRTQLAYTLKQHPKDQSFGHNVTMMVSAVF
jgi:Phosphate-selective porin